MGFDVLRILHHELTNNILCTIHYEWAAVSGFTNQIEIWFYYLT